MSCPSDPTADESNLFKLDKALLSQLVQQDELNLAGNFLQQMCGRRLSDKDIPEIVEFIQEIDIGICKLNLAYNNLTDGIIPTLADLLNTRTGITNVNLCRNDFTPEGCSQLFLKFMNRPTLNVLKLTGLQLGDEGFDALISLIMCGKCPRDLDISETDMTMTHFQGLCAALQAMDRDEDFPQFLADNPLPVSLEELKEMKASGNDAKKEEHNIVQTHSMVDLIGQDAGDMGIKRVGSNEEEEDEQQQSLEKAARTALEGLFEVTTAQLTGEGDGIQQTSLDRAQPKINEIEESAKKMPDAQLGINEFKTIKEIGCSPLDSGGRPVIVCPSIYSLDLDDDWEDEESGLQMTHFNPSPLDNIIEGAKEMALKERHQGLVDEDKANNAADKIVTRIFKEAAFLSTKSDYEERSDVSQILLITILKTCLVVKAMVREQNEEFSEKDLEYIWDSAAEEAVQFIYQKIPTELCSLSPKEILPFVRKFMASSNGTLLRLLENPFISPILLDLCASTVCSPEGADVEPPERDSAVDDDRDYESAKILPLEELILRPVPHLPSGGGVKPMQSNIKKIVMSFLEGAISTAADIIGSGDPFSFRVQERGTIRSALQKSGEEGKATEERVFGAVKDFILAGARLAEDARNTNKELEERFQRSIDPAVEYLEQLFDQVANFIIDIEKRRKDFTVEVEQPSSKYPYASRPHRLVLNRPLFQDFEMIMGAKMGEYLRLNTSVRCLHMRKWGLCEESAPTFFEGLNHSPISNIVLLDLGCNQIGPDAARSLAKFIQHNGNLKHLLLNHNRLRSPGLKYMCEALPGSSIEFLNIAFNDIRESLELFLEILPHTRIRAFYGLGNHFTQKAWKQLKNLLDSTLLIPHHCDFLLQEVDGIGSIVKNSQARDVNEWYDVYPVDEDGLVRAPYFEENAHIKAILNQETI